MTGRVAKLGGRASATEADPLSGMCEPCREKYPKLVDAELACDRAGCEHTSTWTVAEQIEAFAANRPAPQRLCGDCESRLAALVDREVPCSVPGCDRHGIFTKRAQLIAGASETETPAAPTMMCSLCANVYEKIKDRQVTCGIQGCKHKWSWSRDEQIQDYAAGLPNEPPRRLCESCQGIFGAIADREVRCRTSGCKHTWTWPRETQLNSAVAGMPVPKAPHRMCQRCIDLYSATKDIERPCRRPTCKRTWTDKRGAQLARAVRGKTGDPYPHYCTECEKELGEMEDRQVACKTEHCPGTWTWTAAQQLAAGIRPEMKVVPTAVGVPAAAPVAGSLVASQNGSGRRPNVELGAAPKQADVDTDGGEAEADEASTVVAASPGEPSGVGESSNKKRRRRKRRKEIRAPERRCEDCIAFLKDRKTREVPCVGCKTTIFWPPESQLQTHLGNWAEPTLCGACKRDLTEAARAAEREALRSGGVSVTLSEAQTERTPTETPDDDGSGAPVIASPPAAVADTSLN